MKEVYRPVYLTIKDPVHIAKDGVYVTAQPQENGTAAVTVQISLENKREKDAHVRVEAAVYPQAADDYVQDSVRAACSAQTLAAETAAWWKITAFSLSLSIPQKRLSALHRERNVCVPLSEQLDAPRI